MIPVPKSRKACWQIVSLVTLLFCGPPLRAQQIISTVLGTGSDTRSEISGPLETNVGNPFGVEFGPDGALYVCEVTNHRIWRLDLKTQSLSVIAGNGQKGYSGDGGPATDAMLNEPYELRFDAEGNLYFVEMKNHLVRRIDARTKTISTVAGTGEAGFSGDGGPATAAQFRDPHSLALDGRGALYVADIGNHRIRRVMLESGKIETIAGDGTKSLPQAGEPAIGRPVYGPRALFITGRTLWVALREGNSVWRLDLDQGKWHHVAGTGEVGYDDKDQKLAECQFNGPKGIAVDSKGRVLVVDTENQVIRLLDLEAGIASTIAGMGPEHRGHSGDHGPARRAMLNRPHGICVAPDGRIVIGDSENHRVRLIQ